MLGRLLLLFTVVPLVEVYLLVTIGGLLGTVPTVALVLVTGLLGAFLARREGARVLREWQEAIAQGTMPEEGVVSSLLVLVGGVLLVTPGVLTDVVGLSLLIPPSRRAVAALLKRRLAARYELQTVQVHDLGPAAYFEADLGAHFGGFGDGPHAGPDLRREAVEVIEVEARPSDAGSGSGPSSVPDSPRSAERGT